MAKTDEEFIASLRKLPPEQREILRELIADFFRAIRGEDDDDDEEEGA